MPRSCPRPNESDPMASPMVWWKAGMHLGTSCPSALANGSIKLGHISAWHKPYGETAGIPAYVSTGTMVVSPRSVVQGQAGLCLPPSSPKFCSSGTAHAFLHAAPLPRFGSSFALAGPASRCAPDLELLRALGGVSSWERRAQGSCHAGRQAGCGPGRGNRERKALTWRKKSKTDPLPGRDRKSSCKSQVGGYSLHAKGIKSMLGCCMCCSGGTGKGLGLSQGGLLLFRYHCEQRGDEVNHAAHWAGCHTRPWCGHHPCMCKAAVPGQPHPAGALAQVPPGTLTAQLFSLWASGCEQRPRRNFQLHLAPVIELSS